MKLWHQTFLWVGMLFFYPGILWAQSVDPCFDALDQQRQTEHHALLSEQHAAVMVLQSSQHFQEALVALKPYIELAKQSFGPEHQLTLAALSHETQLLFKLEDFDQARIAQGKVLETSRQVLGEKHPLTLTATSNYARTLLHLGQPGESKELQSYVLEARKKVLGEEHLDTVISLLDLGNSNYGLGKYQEAKHQYETSLELSQHLLGENHPQTLLIRSQLAWSLVLTGRLQEAKTLFEKVLSRSHRVWEVTHVTPLRSLAGLCLTFHELGELRMAKSCQEEALNRARRTLGDDHTMVIAAKGHYAKFLSSLGYLKESRRIHEEILNQNQRLFGMEHPRTLALLNNLGLDFHKLGHLQAAQEKYEQVLEMGSRVLGPEHTNLLLTTAHLASIHRQLGNLETARQLDEKTLAARRAHHGAENPDTLRAYSNLAATLLAQGDLGNAYRHYKVIVETHQRLLGDGHPNTLLANLGLSNTLKALGDLESSKQLDESSLEISRRIQGTDHPTTLRIQANLADTFRELGRLQESKEQYEHILQLRQGRHGEAYTATTENEAQELFGLGQTLQKLEEPEEAFQAFVSGLEALEAQTLRLDPSEDVKTLYVARYDSAYKEAIAIGILAKQTLSTFQVLERYRTQSLLSLLRWNQSEAAQDIPLNLRSELHRIARRYDWLTREQNRIYPEQDPELRAEQIQIRRRREVIRGEIIAAKRAKGDLPQPLQAEAVQNLLDSGTLLLSFAVGEDTSHLFALTRDGFEVVTLDVTADVLGTQVDRLRTLDLEDDPSGSRQALSAWLYERLLAPVSSQIQDAQRVLVLPDGPLNLLPLAALTRPNPDDPRGWQYLAEWKPIHSVQSATVYGELLAQRTSTEDAVRPWQWVGFGNPVYPAVADLDPASLPDAVRSTAERGIWAGLTPLPHTEREIQGIAQLFPEDRIQPFLHHDASEDRARQILGQASIVHFAAHGLADPDYPMDSFLALSLDGGDTTEHNGLLQAWEIADQLHLDADLVVLSACVTALGPNRGGEGLISLSRAFQIAGARSVLASLWSVNDLSTSELMLRFYRHLRAGESKDRALQLAQQELMDGPVEVMLEDGSVVERDFSSPYHWAAFQLIGDWR